MDLMSRNRGISSPCSVSVFCTYVSFYCLYQSCYYVSLHSNLFLLVFSISVLLSGLHQSTPALVGLSAASWMRIRPSARTAPHLPQLCHQTMVTSGPRRDESVPRGTGTTWAEPTCTRPQTSLRDMVSGKPVPHSGQTHTILYSAGWSAAGII